MKSPRMPFEHFLIIQFCAFYFLGVCVCTTQAGRMLCMITQPPPPRLAALMSVSTALPLPRSSRTLSPPIYTLAILPSITYRAPKPKKPHYALPPTVLTPSRPMNKAKTWHFSTARPTSISSLTPPAELHLRIPLWRFSSSTDRHLAFRSGCRVLHARLIRDNSL